MPLNHDEAAASITVTGVSLGCVNPAYKRWEVGFIRHPEHSLMMEVTKRTNGVDEPFHPNTEIPTGCSITIEATGAAGLEPQVFTEGGDPEDFEQILDIENDIYDGAKVPFKHPEHEVTPMYVPGAVLYTVADRLNDFPVRLIVKGDRNSRAVKQLGEIGTTAGADIRRGEGNGEVVIRVEGEGGFELRLPPSEGATYFIAFDNTCPGDAGSPRPARRDGTLKTSRAGEPVKEHSDFVLYYTVLDPQQKGLFDLVNDEPGRGDGAVCNYSHLGQTTEIFPLP